MLATAPGVCLRRVVYYHRWCGGSDPERPVVSARGGQSALRLQLVWPLCSDSGVLLRCRFRVVRLWVVVPCYRWRGAHGMTRKAISA